VSPDEIVEVLHASGEIREAVITTEPDALRGDLIVAHVVLQDGASVANLTAFCRAELPRYLQPSRVEAHERLPRTASGKYDPRSLDVARDPV
jgi:acyl-CoA synthetase (AMP-forming)/AMP-acid ligase II